MSEAPAIPNPRPIPEIPLPPSAVRAVLILCSIAVLVSVLPVLYVTQLAGSARLWFSTLFELCVVGAGVIGLLAGIGRFRSGWALALACAAGTLVVTTVFSAVEIRANFRDHASIGPLILPGAGLRLALAALMGGLASVAVWGRDRRSIGLIVRAGCMLAPVAGLAAWIGFGNASVLNTPLASPVAEAIRITAILVGGLICVGLVSVGGHLVIRSYELGRPREESASGDHGG
ncbi:MAG: hypothetical protein AAGA55_00140 [Planctomycetota bacterium]